MGFSFSMLSVSSKSWLLWSLQSLWRQENRCGSCGVFW